MTELTDEQKIECQKILDKLISYNWNIILNKMRIEGKSYEEAFEEWRMEVLNDL